MTKNNLLHYIQNETNKNHVRENYFKKHFINVWTIEDLEVFNQVKNNVDTLTFQHLDVKFVQEELSKR